jgi:WhiB family redox-sensing transcriptional regulator
MPLLAPGQMRYYTPGQLTGGPVYEAPDDDWMSDGLCNETDPDAFFPEDGPGYKERVEEAKKICARCDVLAACREFALKHPTRQDGVWGGLTERERRSMRSGRRGSLPLA